MLTYHFISIRNTKWDFKQDLASYPVPSFCSHHLLLNISIKINTFVPKIHLFTRTKGPVSVLYWSSIALGFKTQPKTKILRGFCIAKPEKYTEILTVKMLRNYARSPKNFRMNKGWLILVSQEMHFCSNVWKKKTQNYRQIFI